MHPLVRDLYKRVILVGRDYPLGLEYVRKTWKKAIRNPQNCPACYGDCDGIATELCERELRKAVGKGRFYVREMVGVIQLKKYRAMKKRYDDDQGDNELKERLKAIVERATAPE